MNRDEGNLDRPSNSLHKSAVLSHSYFLKTIFIPAVPIQFAFRDGDEGMRDRNYDFEDPDGARCVIHYDGVLEKSAVRAVRIP